MCRLHIDVNAAVSSLLPTLSGTEPKLKYYLEVAGPDPVASAELADRLERAVADQIIRAEESGLRVPPHS